VVCSKCAEVVYFPGIADSSALGAFLGTALCRNIESMCLPSSIGQKGLGPLLLGYLLPRSKLIIWSIFRESRSVNRT